MHKHNEIDFFNRDIWYIDEFIHKRNNNTLKKISINFSSIPENLRLLTKIYIYSNLQKHTFSTVKSKLRYIRPFIIFINNKEPGWKDLSLLNIDTLLDFIKYLKDKNLKYKTTNLRILNQVKIFVLYLQKYYPNTVSSINIEEVIRGHRRNYLINNNKNNLTNKFIPFNVIKQFDEKIILIENKVDFVLASIMRNTGLRCNEVFNIKYDKCIVKKNDLYYIIIQNIAKTRVTNKLLPIKADLALKILELSEEVKKISTDNINKEKYLFIYLSGAKVGKRISNRSFINRLNKWAVNNKITDDNGDIFVFKTHSFRHTVATELLNSGMSIENVQKWMSHLNKDMTLTYARPLGDMIYSEYEKIQNHSLDRKLKCTIVDYSYIEKLDLNNRLNKVLKKLGYCIKPKQLNCKYSNNICRGCKFLRCTEI